jgi:hypothetical protein
MTIKQRLDIALHHVGKILSSDQMNVIYLGSCIKDIENNKAYDIDDNQDVAVLQYITDLIQVLVKKEEYELCEELQIIHNLIQKDLKK